MPSSWKATIVHLVWTFNLFGSPLPQRPPLLKILHRFTSPPWACADCKCWCDRAVRRCLLSPNKWNHLFGCAGPERDQPLHAPQTTQHALNQTDSYYCFFSREAASNFLTALSLQRKSRSRQQSHQVMSGNIWAALRIALSMMDQPELFQAANIGDLDLLMRAFNLDIWGMGGSDNSISPFIYSTLRFLPNSQKTKVHTSEWIGSDVRDNSVVFMHVKINCSRQSCHIFRSSTLEQFWGQVLPSGWSDCFVMDLQCNLWFP